MSSNRTRAIGDALTVSVDDRSGISYSEIASKLHLSEQRIIDSACRVSYCQVLQLIDHAVCTSAAVPTTGEFDSLAQVLDIKSPVSITAL